MKALAIAVGLCVASAGAAFALEGTTKPSQHFKALAQVQKPTQLTEGQLDKIEGQATLANANALPPLNPGTSNAVQQIPREVFLAHVAGQWFGRAAGN